MLNRPIVISLENKSLSEQEQQILTHKHIGGLILFTRNFESKQQITSLVTNIKKINSNILIMVDHEGGKVWRFKQDQEFTNPGPMRKIGKLYDKDPAAALTQAYNSGYQIASDLLACGIDLNLAPVVDLDHNNISSVIGDRAFHADPQIVAALAAQFIQGQQTAGMQLAVGKHFPGHGAISADSHLMTAIDNRSQAEIFSQDVEAFRILIEKYNLPAIMPSHVIYPAIDNRPAGFSKKWLQNILREQLKFNGIIISDCLSMKAAQEFIDQNDIEAFQQKLLAEKHQIINLLATKEALEAGCNLVIFNGIYNQDLKHLLDNLDYLSISNKNNPLSCITSIRPVAT